MKQPSPTRRRACNGLVALAAASAPLCAQSGSPAFSAIAQEVGAGAVDAAGGAFQAEATLSMTGGSAASSEYQVETGWIHAEYDPGGDGPPIVFGVQPRQGDKLGGDDVQVVGLHFAGSTPTVSFGGFPATGVAVLSNTSIAATTPDTADPCGNPAGAVPVAVVDPAGFGVAQDAYVFVPALVQVAPAHVGGTLQLGFEDGGSTFFALFFGTDIGVCLSIPPLAGSFALAGGFELLLPLTFSPSGSEILPFPVPDKPALAGMSFDFQGISLVSLAPEGEFTNVLTVTIQA